MTLTHEQLKAGTRLGRYTVQRSERLPEIDATFYELRHDLGSRHVHIAREDDNLTFTVLFPTVPQDSTGVAHILEHIVLAGSRQFPVKDPFFSMQPRSLNTFSNAFTASDWTAYPFSTRNEQDFFNMLSVYLDAAFFPLLRKETFLREAWRLEFDPIDDPQGELKLQGVVYNEMKGGMASASSQMHRALGKALYPDLTYAVNSGGEPTNIPDLTWEGLRDFHARHYHPSNAYFFTYGNLPIERFLNAIEAQVMSQFAPLELDVGIPDQPRFDTPKQVEVAYPSSDAATGAQVLLAWMVAPSFDSFDVLRWNVLSDVLLGNPAAPLRRALIESGLGSATADLTGYHDDFRQSAFAAGLKGLSISENADIADSVEALVLGSLQRIADEGIETELVDSAIHQLELSRKEVSNSGWPYSLKVFFRFASTWLYGGDPLRALRLEEDLSRLNTLRAQGGFFERMIREELLDNPHRVRLVLRPDPAMPERQLEEERSRVSALSAEFTDEDRRAVVETAVELARLQEQPDDTSVLPTLELRDIPRGVPRPAYGVQQGAGATVGRAPQPTSGAVYLDVQLNVGALPTPLLDVLPLYAYALTRSGAGGLDYVGLSRRIEAQTGGVSASAGVSTGPDDLDDVRASFTVSGKALSRNAAHLVDIVHDLLAEPAFDLARLTQLTRQQRAGMESGVVSSGHVYARGLATAQLSSAAALAERQGGLSQLARLKGLDDEARLTGLLEDFAEITRALRATRARVLLTATPADLELDLSPVTGLFGGGEARTPEIALPSRVPQARTTDVPVSYHAKSFRAVPYTHRDAPALLALAHLLRSEYMLRELREKGGAYGGFATYDPQGGLFGMLSYRDPRMARTYQVFQAARDFVNGPLGERELREAILSASTQLDPLTSPDTVARMRFFGDQAGYTPEVQERFKSRLLEVTLGDMRRVFDEHLHEEAAAYAMVTGRDPNAELAEMGLQFEVTAI
nr:insulinase family protein [Deinococcus peraridilitoris]